MGVFVQLCRQARRRDNGAAVELAQFGQLRQKRCRNDSSNAKDGVRLACVAVQISIVRQMPCNRGM